MDSGNDYLQLDGLLDVLEHARTRGVTVWSENGQLRYRGPKGALTQEEIARLRASKHQIAALLDFVAAAETVEPKMETRRFLARAPLAFSQLAQLHYFQLLGERYTARSARIVASGFRIHGRLDVDALRSSVAEMIHRHEALRTRIIESDGVPVQEVADTLTYDLPVDDLTEIPEGLRDSQIQRIISELILEPIDVTVGPLFGMRLISLSESEHILILAMEHVISDGTSLTILTRELLTTYLQVSNGQPIKLPPIEMQLFDYALWQRDSEAAWVEKNGAYWNERIMHYERLRFPEDKARLPRGPTGWGAVTFLVNQDLRKELTDWCRLKRTTIVLAVFTAFVALVLRWCGVKRGVFQYQTNGRFSQKVEHTVGCFTSPLYLVLELLEQDTFEVLLRRVVLEYCSVTQHADLSYLTARVPRPDFTRTVAFNWTPRGSNIELPNSDAFLETIKCTPFLFPSPTQTLLQIDSEPGIQLHDADEEIAGNIFFPLNRLSVQTMERFCNDLLIFIRTMLKSPEALVKDVMLE